MNQLTNEDCENVRTIINKRHPELGEWEFEYCGQGVCEGRKMHSARQRDAARFIDNEAEWLIASYKKPITPISENGDAPDHRKGSSI